MGKNFKFTVLSAVYNTGDYLKESIESIINQDFGFEENIQLILVDDGSSDNSYDIALEYQQKYPDNIVVLTQENSGPGSARNLGLKYIEGEYVNFLDSDDLLSLNTMSVIDDFLSDYDVDIVAIPLMYFGVKEGNHHLNYKFEKEDVIDLTDRFDYPQASMASAFIKSSLLENQQFNPDLINGEDLLLLNKILINVKKYGVTDRAQYMYRKRAESSSIMDNAKKYERFFLEKMQLCYKELIDYSLKTEGEVLKFIQYIIALDLNAIVESPFFEEVYSNPKKLDEFWECLEDILSYIDEDIIKDHLYLSRDVKSFYIFIKNNDFNIEINERRNRVFIKSKDYMINRLHRHNIYFDIIDIKNNFICISAVFVSNCYSSSIHIQANTKTPDGKNDVYDCKYVEYPTTYRVNKKMLNIPWKFYYNFDVKIPIKNDNLKITFEVLFDEDGQTATFRPDFRFRNYCSITKTINYFVDGSKIVLNKDKAIHVVDYGHMFRLKLELKSILKMLLAPQRFNVYNVFIHIITAFAYIFMKNRRIWLFMDRPTVADDNAKHLFEYSIKHEDDGVEKYFIIDKKSPDYNKMLKISKNIIPWNSFKHKIYYIYAEKFISTHIDHVWINPFYYREEQFTNGLATNKLYFLQHGVTKDDISHWLRKFYHNFYLLLAVSDYEKESFLSENYNYEEDVVQTFGFPRFDGLEKNQSKKHILFMPTWRNYLIDEDSFVKSDYYKTINSFFNNEELLKLVKDNGYKIIFKPHFNLLEFFDLLEIPDEIEISTQDSYQTLFNNSLLLITDYSSVFFDFSYLKKPVIYYHADDNYHYGVGYFDYETMGFGEVIKSEDKLVNQIRYYLENECEMEEKFKNRVEDFFKYTDKNNCKRVYEWLLEE